jgi:hypothetical protein
MSKRIIAIAAFVLLPALSACNTDTIIAPDSPVIELRYGG